MHWRCVLIVWGKLDGNFLSKLLYRLQIVSLSSWPNPIPPKFVQTYAESEFLYEDEGNIDMRMRLLRWWTAVPHHDRFSPIKKRMVQGCRSRQGLAWGVPFT
jgi:hypothetical protein